MKSLNKIDSQYFKILIKTMAESGIPHHRVYHVYHYLQGNAHCSVTCSDAVQSYLECRASGDRTEVANWADTGLYNICIEDIRFPGGFGDEVKALSSNTGKPVIVQELKDGYRLIDGWGRVSGMLNAGCNEIQAILVSESDIAERTTTGDDEEWNAAMYARYTRYQYCGSTN